MANPILNNPYEEPISHYATNEKGELNYEDVRPGRRIFIPDFNVIPTPQGPQADMFEVNDYAEEYSGHLVNLVRREVKIWRESAYPHITRVTKELLTFWFNNDDRPFEHMLFFAQRESIETAVWLNEAAEKSNVGQHVLNIIQKAVKAVSSEPSEQLPRTAFKMATGTGKTVVMAALIFYHLANRREYRNDTRFADYFLVVTPGITIRDRLGVLFVDKKTTNRNRREDYYAVRNLVPAKYSDVLDLINSRLMITNYHGFEQRTLQGNKRSPFDGKVLGHDEKGKAIKQEAKEDFNQVVKRVLGSFKPNSKLLIINDEAHHCYLPKSKGRTKDNEESDENAKAAVWFTGIREVAKRYKVKKVYDLTATPYYLQGSGYTPYSLFGWVVSDFGLIEAIESGLVKIPYLPESDSTQQLTMPVLRNLYEHVKDALPKKGQKTKRKDAKKEGKKLSEEPPTLLIDSEALEDAGQISADFKKIFASEIEEFKREYAVQHGQGAVQRITEAEILREVVNTVGKKGKLGGHIRCVVSVSMLTEGWDANTVTHIMGLRAFGSQLLCEQVAGRALRRMNYNLQGYGKEGNPTKDRRKIVSYKFPPEYAHIIEVPFKMFKGGTTEPGEPPNYVQIDAIPERQREFEIEFPNVEGYKTEYQEDEIQFDFSKVENYEIDGSKFPVETVLATAFSGEEQKLSVQSVLEMREQEILYVITKEILTYHFSDGNGSPEFHKFNRIKKITEYWYNHKIQLLNIIDPAYKKLVYFDHPKKIADHVAMGINPHVNTSEYIRPRFNFHNPFSSTKYVSGLTSKDVYKTKKSHVNYVVMDSDWEGVCAKTLEELDAVDAYVKNQFLGFTIPYVKEGDDKRYYPDFLCRVTTKSGNSVNLIIEVTGFNKDKAEKKWYMENRWLPAVNAVRRHYGYEEWYFIEIANDIRDIKNQLTDKIRSISR